VLRKEANDRCVTPSFPEGIKENGESLSIFELLEKIKSDDMLDPEMPSPTPAVEPATDGVSNDGLNSSFFKVDPEIFDEMARQNNELWLKLQMCRDRTEVNRILFGDSADRELVVDYGDLHRVTKYRSVKGFIEI
jgi:hypothetical protein